MGFYEPRFKPRAVYSRDEARRKTYIRARRPCTDRPLKWTRACGFTPLRSRLFHELANKRRQRHSRAMHVAVVVPQIANTPLCNSTICIERRDIRRVERGRCARHHPKAAV